MQCYEKTRRNWATCREVCTPGPDPTDANGDPWTCKELGPRSAGQAPPPAPMPKAAWVDKQCSRNGEDCSKSMCCREAGNQCFKKDKRWATCRSDCLPGPSMTDVNISELPKCLILVNQGMRVGGKRERTDATTGKGMRRAGRTMSGTLTVPRRTGASMTVPPAWSLTASSTPTGTRFARTSTT